MIPALLLLIGLVSTANGTESACVFEFTGIGVDNQTLAAATQIFRTELNSQGKFAVLSKGDMESRLNARRITDYTCDNVTCASELGYELGVRYSIIGNLTRLGEKIIAEVQLIGVVEKSVEFSDKFTAASESDLDVTLARLAQAISSRRKIESEVGRFAITERETAEPRRKKAYITSGASFGFGFPFGKSYADVSNLKTLAWTLRYEADKFVIDNSIGVSWGSAKPDTFYGGVIDDRVKITIVPWDIGLRYIFNRESDFTPFVGGGLGFHFVGRSQLEGYYHDGGENYIESDQALAIHLAGGVYAFQSYDFRFALEAKYTILFSDAFGPDSPSSSQQIGIALGISRKFEPGEKRGCMSGGCLF